MHPFREPLLDSPKERTATGQPDSVAHDVSVNFWRYGFQHLHYTILDLSDGLVYAAGDIMIRDRRFYRV